MTKCIAFWSVCVWALFVGFSTLKAWDFVYGVWIVDSKAIYFLSDSQQHKNQSHKSALYFAQSSVCFL